MTILSYKGYQGSVAYDDGSLLIQILHIDDFVSANCMSAEDVVKEFESLVDDYIDTCAELGREPQKAFSGTFNVRMAPELHRQAAMAATRAELSLNAWMAEAVKDRLRRDDNGEAELLNALMREDLMAYKQSSARFTVKPTISQRISVQSLNIRRDLDPREFFEYVSSGAGGMRPRKLN